MVEYKEELWVRLRWKSIRPIHSFRFRFDPVPFTRGYRHRFRHYYKRPKTTQERRLSYKDKDYVRKKRYGVNLPNIYDDRQRGDIRNRKSWKKRYKCRKQWMKRGV